MAGAALAKRRTERTFVLDGKGISGRKGRSGAASAGSHGVGGGQGQAESALEAERKTSNEKIELVTRASEELRNAFKAMAADALKSNNSSFLVIAEETLKRFQSQAKGDLEARQKAVADMVAPVRDSLNKVDAQIQQMEVARGDAYGELRAQVQSLITTQKELQSETGNLVRALRTPNVRGRWGEIQLRRVVEIAGMLSYCDFAEQESVTTDSGRLRPDLVVKLPGGKHVVVDAKTPLQAFLDAFETTDEDARRACLANHARQVRDHMNTLSGKKYWEQFEATPEFVVMFLPGETFFSAALEQDSGLIEHGVLNRVIPASPTTLIALLKAITTDGIKKNWRATHNRSAHWARNCTTACAFSPDISLQSALGSTAPSSLITRPLDRWRAGCWFRRASLPNWAPRWPKTFRNSSPSKLPHERSRLSGTMISPRNRCK